MIIFNFLLYVETAPSLSNLKLNLDGYDNRPRYNWPANEQATNSDRIRLELIEKAIDLLNTQTQDTKRNDINNCLYKRDSLMNILNCVKYFVDKSKERRSQNHFPKNNKHYQYNIKKDFNEYDSDETDLTKTYLNKSFNGRSNFSQDYLDVADLLRTNADTKDDKTKNRYVPKSVKTKNKYGRFDYDLSRFRKYNPSREVRKSRSDSNSDYSASSGSQEVDRKRKGMQRDHKTADKSFDVDSSAEISSEEMQIQKVKPKKLKKAIPKVKKAQVLYMQGPSRLYQEDSRRRLPYFFPKRLHWDENDIKSLRNYWINGPQGKYSGYRIPY
ncbi:uncharacterized protein LOC125075395 [Vanessa atalanta]|uniref:uncharacterized protein LOC125075395 n=1 Tax=Vanessa atalanta TaxID=42275 RepID=UPI001FCD659D|nr:uncharacterized protein LOC125075395 [Vanessa atalanta]